MNNSVYNSTSIQESVCVVQTATQVYCGCILIVCGDCFYYVVIHAYVYWLITLTNGNSIDSLKLTKPELIRGV